MIYKLELTNYRCHKSLVKDFDEGLNIIADANGTGKTSIVEAISFALFGNKLTRGKASSWITHGEKHGKVKLYLDNYIITRGDNEQLVEDLEGTVLARQHVGVDEWIEKTYGFNADLYSTANYIAQKDIETFAGLQSIERIKRVEKLLRIDNIDKLQQTIKEVIKEKKKLSQQYSLNLKQHPFDQDEMDAINLDLINVNQELSNQEIEYKEALVAKGAYEQQLVQWNKKEAIRKIIHSLTYKEITESPKQLLEEENKVKDSRLAEKKLEKFSEIKSENIPEHVQQLREQYLELLVEYNTLKTIEENCPTCGQTIPDASLLVEKCTQLKIELDQLKIQGEDAALSFEKYQLEQQVYPSNYSVEELQIMQKDLQNYHYLEQYEDLKDIVKPSKINISSIETPYKQNQRKEKELQTTFSQLTANKIVYDQYAELTNNLKKDLCTLEKFLKFISQYRKEFSQNVIPLIETNASTIFSHLTGNKYSTMNINKDYSIDTYEDYSGSEADAASFALRMAIANSSRIGNFETIILDEVAASFDNQKEELLVELLEKTNNQLIYISHGDI